MRIEEIKDRLKLADNNGVSSAEWGKMEVGAFRDIKFLLEQNQRSVEALERANEYIKYMEEAGECEVGQCRSFEQMLDDNVVNEVYHVVVKALQDYK